MGIYGLRTRALQVLMFLVAALITYGLIVFAEAKITDVLVKPPDIVWAYEPAPGELDYSSKVAYSNPVVFERSISFLKTVVFWDNVYFHDDAIIRTPKGEYIIFDGVITLTK